MHDSRTLIALCFVAAGTIARIAGAAVTRYGHRPGQSLVSISLFVSLSGIFVAFDSDIGERSST
jgi:purine-cytosine permease-like protein